MPARLLRLGLIGLLAAMAVGAIGSASRLWGATEAARRAERTELEIRGVHTAVLEAESALRGYLLTLDPRFLEDYRA